MTLEVRNLSKSLGGNKILEDVSFTVPTGEFLVLLGPSGGGKSTLLRLICGLETPDQGEIWLDGRNITALAAKDRQLGMVFQDYGLYPNMNVYDNIAYGLQAKRMAKPEIERRIIEATSKLGLTEHLRKFIGELSGGEQQRVALARAISKDAAAYLYDEPLSNLDPKLRHSARQDIAALHRLKQKPSIYVTHDQSEAFALGDRVALIGLGRLQQIGTPDALLERPENLFTARFAGSPATNLITGRLEANGTFEAKSFSLRLELPTAQLGVREVILGIRPDAIHLAGNQFNAAEDSLFGVLDDQTTQSAILLSQPIQAVVRELEPLIGETLIGFELSGGLIVTAQIPDMAVELPAIGQTTELNFDLNRIRLFDPTSQQVLPYNLNSGQALLERGT